MSPLSARPLVLAHRGFSGRYPENTLAAFEAGLELGVDGSECDVHLSADGVPILLHDGSFARTGGLDRRPSELTLADIRTLDVGSSKDARFAGEAPPTLVEALDLHRGRGVLAIELKCDDPATQLVEAVLAAIAQTDAYGWAFVCSFGLDYIAESVRREPGVPGVWILGDLPGPERVWPDLLAPALHARLVGLSVNHHRLRPDAVLATRRLAMGCWAWTVNTLEDAEAALGAGVTALISDWPDRLIAGSNE